MHSGRNKQIFLHISPILAGLWFFPALSFAAIITPSSAPPPTLPAPDRQLPGGITDFTPAQPPEAAPPQKIAPAPETPAELQHLLNIAALRSEFMVIALTCDMHQEYDKFLTKFRPVLQQNYDLLKADFLKLYQSKGEMRLDQYMTDLADAASLKAAREGGNFCKTHEQMFREAGYFQTTEDLAAYAEGKNLATPLPKSPTGRRDMTPVTHSEATSFANFAHPIFTSPPAVPNKVKKEGFVPIKKYSKIPPLNEEKPKRDSHPAEEKPPERILFPAMPASEAPKAPSAPLMPVPSPQPYPEISPKTAPSSPPLTPKPFSAGASFE